MFASIRSSENPIEELLTGAEQVLPTPHPHVRTAIDDHGDGAALETRASQPFVAAQRGHADAVRAALVEARCVAVAADRGRRSQRSAVALAWRHRFVGRIELGQVTDADWPHGGAAAGEVEVRADWE